MGGGGSQIQGVWGPGRGVAVGAGGRKGGPALGGGGGGGGAPRKGPLGPGKGAVSRLRVQERKGSGVWGEGVEPRNGEESYWWGRQSEISKGEAEGLIKGWRGF